MTNNLTVAIVGGGPAGLMAATILCEKGYKVDLFDRMPSVGRKFLLAGRGGLNLTHSDPLEKFVTQYRGREDIFASLLDNFKSDDTLAWATSLGIETFVGTSGRIFPKDFKAAPLLRAWVRDLRSKGVAFHVRHRWQGFDDAGNLVFDQGTYPASATILALGGASWPTMGSDGKWTKILEELEVGVAPLKPSNCGFLVDWSDKLKAGQEGMPLKNIALNFSGDRVIGDIVVTQYGIEGTPIYALSGPLRNEIEANGSAQIFIDLKPGLPWEEVREKLEKHRGKASLTNHLRKTLNLTKPAISLVLETTSAEDRTLVSTISKRIKATSLTLKGTSPIEEVISSAGGVQFNHLNDDLMLNKRPGVFIAGEMLDWEAPTGGYLLQGCFSTGVKAAQGAINWLENI
ncbi:MAG: TIGR03862 family flavoprotein [Rhodospirillales bacterium]|nr:TIGR03862 family flavoprotein [Rhodospirillales bacterium]